MGAPSTGSALSGILLRGNLKPVSPLTPGVPAIGSSMTRSLGSIQVSTLRPSLHPRAGWAHLRSRCEAHVRGFADVAAATSSCSLGAPWSS